MEIWLFDSSTSLTRNIQEPCFLPPGAYHTSKLLIPQTTTLSASQAAPDWTYDTSLTKHHLLRVPKNNSTHSQPAPLSRRAPVEEIHVIIK